MKINRNMSAVTVNRQMMRTESRLSASMRRLSSGLKINRAGDNPAGMAISNKMKAQIDGLNQARSNTSDAISVVRIADGALTEVSSMLQRIRELSVQAANGTTSVSDRQSIQAEISKLSEEVNRISSDTEYNTKPLLNGSSDVRVYSKEVTRTNISDTVLPGKYKLKVVEPAEQGKFEFSISAGTPAGTISINDITLDYSPDMTKDEFFEQLRTTAEQAGCVAERTADGQYTVRTEKYGSSAEMQIEFSKALGSVFSGSNGWSVNGEGEIVGTNGKKIGCVDSKTGEYTVMLTGKDAVVTAEPSGTRAASSMTRAVQNGVQFGLDSSDFLLPYYGDFNLPAGTISFLKNGQSIGTMNWAGATPGAGSDREFPKQLAEEMKNIGFGSVEYDGNMLMLHASSDSQIEINGDLADGISTGMNSSGWFYTNIVTDSSGNSREIIVTASNIPVAERTVDAATGETSLMIYPNYKINNYTLSKASIPSAESGFGKTATISTDGLRVKVTDNGGFSMDFLVNEDNNIAGQQVEIEVTDIGTMEIQIGSNTHQDMGLRIPEISAESLYLDWIDVTEKNGPEKSMVIMDEAISKLNEVRSRIGAFHNRLEYAEKSLAETEEDMTDAYSGLLDTDMAEEMTEYTLQNVLSQASISVLSQANDLPQQVLSLLQ